MRPIKTAVFPVAGFGTRMLPATKSIPKELLTIVDRPAIQYVVDEARDAGIEHFIFVTGRGKSAIEDHFGTYFELEEALRRSGKTDALHLLAHDMLGCGHASFTRQHQALGLGHAIGCARRLVGNEPFAVLLPDMIMRADPGCLKQMMKVYEDQNGGNIIALERVTPADVSRYGVVDFNRKPNGALQLTGMVEKPKREEAPSNFIISGRYILQPEVFQYLETATPGAGGEIQLTDALVRMMLSHAFWGMQFHGETFDVGSKLGFLQANITLGLADKDVGQALRLELENLILKSRESAHRSAA